VGGTALHVLLGYYPTANTSNLLQLLLTAAKKCGVLQEVLSATSPNVRGLTSSSFA
jgi:hypothetical protein